MEAPYQISENDYVQSIKLASKPKLRNKLIYLCIWVVLVISYFFVNYYSWFPICVGVIVATMIILFCQYLLAPFMARRHYRKYKMIQQQFTLELVEDGLNLTSPNGTGAIKWEQMLKWRENKGYILIYIMPRLFHIIPKSIEKNGFEIQLLTEQLYKHLGQST